jgi:NAD(P)-dependent dehydrogenase (short-subunit alcohol dehydrogenase family)
MDLGLRGKVALVTGGASGIGAAVARTLAREGVTVAIGDICDAAAAVVAAEIAQGGGRGLAVPLDVGREASCLAAVEQVTGELGPVDILINNAGICPCHALAEIAGEEWDQVLRVNLKGAFVLSQAVLPGMLARGWGRIVNVASMAGKVGGLAVGAHYSASKAGLICLAKSLAKAGASQGVTANAVAPAFIRTSLFTAEALARYAAQIPVGRPGEPEEVAHAVAFLASEQAGFITGATLDLNGGLLMD